jgi:tetrahydromethanopterin S-methyltransferase subunit G
MLLQLDELEAITRRLREQQHELEQLGQVINQLAQQIGRPGVAFVPHRVL